MAIRTSYKQTSLVFFIKSHFAASLWRLNADKMLSSHVHIFSKEQLKWQFMQTVSEKDIGWENFFVPKVLLWY